MIADLNNVQHLLIRCEAINEVVEEISKYLERKGLPDLAKEIAKAFTDAVGE